MQTITAELEAILKAKFQAGASGFRGKVVVDFGGEIGVVTRYPISMDVDHSLQVPASGFSATFTNESGEVGLASESFPINHLFTAWAWYGDEANEIRVFTGFVDRVQEHRDPRTVTITARDWCKPLLTQDILVLFPQAVDEEGAVRETSNFVFLNLDVSDIVNTLLDQAGYPAAARAIQGTNFVVSEWLGRDGSSYMDAIGELADIVAFNAFADELGVFHFQADGKVDGPVDTDNPPTPAYVFRTGEDIVELDPQRDDYDTKTRVRAVGPYTTLQDAWTELWHTNVIVNPTGVRYDEDDSTHLYVADGPTKKVYKILQSDRSIVSSTGALVTTYLNGLSGDPSDDTVYWTFDTPWITTGTPTNNKIRKHLKSDNSVVATFTLANELWTDMKVGADAIWATNFTDDKVHKLSKTDGSEIAEYVVVDAFTNGGTRTPTGTKYNPIGLAIDGTDLYMAFYGEATMLRGQTTDPSDIDKVLVFSGTKSLGGDIDTTTHTELYACSGGLSLVFKYTMVEPVTTEVSVEVANTALEATLGAALDTGAEIRRLILRLDVVTSLANATEAAARWLDKLDQYLNVMDVGIIGNPALQKGDMVRVEDPVTSIANDFQIDTYRSSLSADGTYLGTLALVPWSSSYSGPGDVYPVVPPAPDGLARFMGSGDGGDALGWQGVNSGSGGPPGSTHYYYNSGWNPFKMTARGGIGVGQTAYINGWTVDSEGNASLSFGFYSTPVGDPVTSGAQLAVVVLQAASPHSSWTQFAEQTLVAPAGTVSWALWKSGGGISFDEIVVEVV